MISIIRKHFFDYIIGLLTLSTRNNKKSNNFTRKSTQNCLDGKKKTSTRPTFTWYKWLSKIMYQILLYSFSL